MPIMHTLFPAQELSDNQSRPISLGDKNILVCRANGAYYAVDNQCTHQKAELTAGRIRNCFISCPLHGARFDLRTGMPIGELTKVPLKVYAIQVSAGGDLQISLD